jgi:hypothetical protein
VVDTGNPVNRAISVTEWLPPVRKVDRIAVIRLTADRGGGFSWLGTTRASLDRSRCWWVLSRTYWIVNERDARLQARGAHTDQ